MACLFIWHYNCLLVPRFGSFEEEGLLLNIVHTNAITIELNIIRTGTGLEGFVRLFVRSSC